MANEENPVPESSDAPTRRIETGESEMVRLNGDEAGEGAGGE
jgi:hypothetical protein